ncbi:unnamed protein product [Leptosia nina]|uniref:Uncharacterized protein n=1 Tax=Leptosia nina TaxID=320188 RepID=A0AAV1JIC8_9NEOP
MKRQKKSKRDKSASHTFTQGPGSAPKQSKAPPVEEIENEVPIGAILNPLGQLLELQFFHTTVPGLLLRILALCIPYQHHLTRITIRWGIIDCYTIHEINRILPQSQISELYLDDSPLPHRCYALLLIYQTRLKCLSLDRCRLDDDDCIEIASKLVHPYPASKNITTLSMASNMISNTGAGSLATMLRSNRQLRHLNLTGNRISNNGAVAILTSLMHFPLTTDEIVSKRLRTIQYIKLRQEIYSKCFNEVLISSAGVENRSDDRRASRKKPTARLKSVPATSLIKALSEEDAIAKAKMMTTELIGTNNEPFNRDYTFVRDGLLYSNGNLTLCYLNLSYNNLGHPSTVKLVEVMQYQEERRRSELGLVRVVLDGNPLPESSYELQQMQRLFDRTDMTNVIKTVRKSEKISQRIVRR